MGILLVGVVAALFFRNEPLAVENGLTSEREHELNEKLRDRDVSVYHDPDAAVLPDSLTDEPQWTLPEFFDRVRNSDTAPIPIGAVPPVEPQIAPVTADVAQRDPARFKPPAPADRTLAEPKQTGTPEKTELSMQDVLTSATRGASKSSRPSTAEFQEYTVEFGDTLSEISEKFLGSQGRYREIYEMNKDRMSSPDRLRVGRAIRVPRTYR